MQQQGEGPPDDVPPEGDPPGLGLRPGSGPGSGPGRGEPHHVRLRREYKGLTVRDLVTDLSLAQQLPGKVRSALAHVERGDYAAAEAALPGHFAAVLPGPGGA